MSPRELSLDSPSDHHRPPHSAMRNLLYSAAALCALSLGASAQILYVDGTVSASGNGTSWGQAYKTIQEALAAATPGTKVWVASTGGFYNGPFHVPAGVSLMGEFLGDELNGPAGYVTERQREFANKVVLSGGFTDRTVTVEAGAVLDGLWIQFGTAGAPGGGGLLIDGIDCTVRNCVFQFNNDTVGSGAALLVRNGANPIVENCVFFGNGDAASGAAIAVDNASGTFRHLTVRSNQHDGMKLTNGATPRIVNSIFSSNGVGGAARGIDQVDTSADPSLLHNLFFGNTTALYRRGGIDLTSAAEVNALNYSVQTIEGNPAYNGPNDHRLTAASAAIDVGLASELTTRPQGFYDQSRQLDGNLDGLMAPDLGAAEFSNCTLTIPVDIHRHMHLGVAGTAGLPAILWFSLQDLPTPILVNPVGYLWADPNAPFIILPYGPIPTPPSQVINYTPSTPSGLILYVHAMTLGGTGGANVSNLAVHITN